MLRPYNSEAALRGAVFFGAKNVQRVGVVVMAGDGDRLRSFAALRAAQDDSYL
jgi:hypothetical protein